MVKKNPLSIGFSIPILIVFVIVLFTTSCLRNRIPIAWGPPRLDDPFPANGSLDQSFDLVLRWSGIPGNPREATLPSVTITHYCLRLFSENETDAEKTVILRETEYALENLRDNTCYRWTVTAFQNDGQSTKSPEWTFHTKTREYADPQISLIFPGNDATDQATDIILTWVATPGKALEKSERAIEIAEFRVHISEEGAEEPTIAVVKHPFFQKNALEYGTTYRWYVVALQSDGKTATSTVWAFQTTPRRYAEPSLTLLEPEEGQTNMDTRVKFSWEGTPGDSANLENREGQSLEYDLFLRRDGQPYGSPIHTTSCRKTISSLLYGSDYLWKVVAYQPDGQSVESEERTFRTKEATYAPPLLALKYPGNTQTDCATTITLSWEATPGHQTNHSPRGAVITRYDLYCYRHGDSLPLPISLIEKEYSIQNLEYNQSYRWKVIVHQSDEQTTESEERSFATQKETFYPPQTALIFPLNGATDMATTVLLSWEATPGVRSNADIRENLTLIGFRLYFAGEGTPLGTPTEIDNPETREWEISELDRGATYRWTVEALQSDGQSASSSTYQFRTIPPPIALYESNGALLARYDRLGQAINDAPDKGFVIVRGGTTLTNEEVEIQIRGKEITITGQLNNPFTIDMEERGRIFYITDGASVTLENINLTGGNVSGKNDGGAIYLSGSATHLTIKGARILRNRTARHGGGIHVLSGTLSLYDSLITENEAGTSGGGIDARGGVLRIENCLISNNAAVTAGGGLYVTNAATITGSTISENASTRYGGGIYLTIGALVAEETSIQMNCCVDADGFGEGGGVYIYNNGALRAEDLVINGNTATKNGGGIVLNQGTIAANRLTVSNNAASSGEGGGIFRDPSGGILTTNGFEWEQAGDRQLEFSVSSEGTVQTDGTRRSEDPVQLFQNLSFSDGNHQMKW